MPGNRLPDLPSTSPTPKTLPPALALLLPCLPPDLLHLPRKPFILRNLRQLVPNNSLLPPLVTGLQQRAAQAAGQASVDGGQVTVGGAD